MATILISFLRAATVVIGLLFMAIALGAWHFYGLVWAVPFSIAGVALLLVQALLKAHASPLPGISRPANMEPTHAQLALAAKMKIPIVTGMSRADVSHLLTKALDRRTPIERARDEARSVDEGRRDAAMKARWGHLLDRQALLIYRDKNGLVVDVVQVVDVELRDKGAAIHIGMPRLVNEPHIGRILDWERVTLMPEGKIVLCEPLREEVHFADVEGYKRIVRDGLKRAKKLR